MESRIESIVSGANEVVSMIYQKIGEIDNCKAVLKNLEEAELSLLMPEGELAELRPALDDEQLTEVKYIMERMITARIECAAEYLENVSGGKPEKLPEPVAAEQEKLSETVAAEPEYEPMMALEPEPTPDFPQKKAPGKGKMTVAAVEQMLKDGYTAEDIAEYYGYKTAQTVHNFISKNKIKASVLTQGNDKAKELTEEDIPEIRALYTDGPFNLTEAAAELKTTKKKLREFCEKHRLLKITQVR